MESISVAYIDAYFVLFQNISTDSRPEVLFFHFLSFVVQLKECVHKHFYPKCMCDFQNLNYSLAACLYVMCFISYCSFGHKEFSESVVAFLLASTRVSVAVHVCIGLLNVFKWRVIWFSRQAQSCSNPGPYLTYKSKSLGNHSSFLCLHFLICQKPQ